MLHARSAPRFLILVASILVTSAFSWAPAGATSFINTLGWEDDVDLVVAPNGEFLVLPEENAAGTTADIRIVDLNPTTGALVAPRSVALVHGWEQGVDPIIVPELGTGLGSVVVAPMESADGRSSGALVLRVDRTGVIVASTRIETGNLGVREDVDVTWNQESGSAIAYLPMESEDRSVRGILAIDVDPRDIGDPPGIGAATLVSTDGRGGEGIRRTVLASWLPGLAPGMDAVCYPIADGSRLALPVTGSLGSDLLLVDFDPRDTQSPALIRHVSVKALNALSARPTTFPGFEQDVHLRLFDDECGFSGARRLLVPVEGPGVADLYLLDENGQSLKTLSRDGFASAPLPILGFEKGVDLVPLCGLGGAHPQRVAVPLENAAGTDADLWMLDLATFQVIARAEDPLVNPGLVIAGWEVGVDLVPWTSSCIAAPTQNAAGTTRLYSFDTNLVRKDTRDFPASSGRWAFRASVDPVVATVHASPYRTLFVPLDDSVTNQSDLYMFRSPPRFDGGSSLGAWTGLLEWGVDPGLSRPSDPGGAYVYVPEEGPAGTRLRIESTPGPSNDFVLLVATERRSSAAPALRFFSAENGSLLWIFSDLYGLEDGMDLANGRGPTTPPGPPLLAAVAGQDGDSDPTPSAAASAVEAGGPAEPSSRAIGSIQAMTPAVPPIDIRFAVDAAGPLVVSIVDAAGRRTRELARGHFTPGDLTVTWDGRDDHGARAGAGVYFVEVSTGRAVRASKIVLVK